MQQTDSQAQPDCPPLGEAIDRILQAGVNNPQAVERPTFQRSFASAQREEEPIRNGMPNTLYTDGEKPVYRLICYMSLGGKTNKEIADEVGMSTATVSNILRQPASKEFMAREARRIAGDQIENIFKSELGKTFTVMLELRDDEKTPATTRAQVCRDICDRALGKPTVFVKSESQISYDQAKEEIADIDRQLAALRTRTRAPSSAN